jgi:HAD superfamily hydrolase (TIGR01509 family)
MPPMPRLDRLPKAVIFDMDGLMLDTEPLAARAWHDAAAAVGATFDHDLTLRLTGRNFVDCSALIRTHYPTDYPVDALLGGWHAAYDAIVARAGLARKPGVLELIAWLEARGIPLAVATSTRRARAEIKLAMTALLPHFRALVGGDEVARGKPHPDIYLEAARRIAVPPAHCLVLEDSEPGVRGALAAGMTPIMIPDLLRPSADLLAAAPLVEASLHDVIVRLAALPA